MQITTANFIHRFLVLTKFCGILQTEFQFSCHFLTMKYYNIYTSYIHNLPKEKYIFVFLSSNSGQEGGMSVNCLQLDILAHQAL